MNNFKIGEQSPYYISTLSRIRMSDLSGVASRCLNVLSVSLLAGVAVLSAARGGAADAGSQKPDVQRISQNR